MFKNIDVLKQHLKDTHKLQIFAQIEQYCPPPEPTPIYRENQPCWIDNCGTVRKDRNGMIKHLKGVHKMLVHNARASVEACATFDDIVIPRKEVKRGPHLAAIDCDNATDEGLQMKKKSKTKKTDASSSAE
jgi:hypothetical protein